MCPHPIQGMGHLDFLIFFILIEPATASYIIQCAILIYVTRKAVKRRKLDMRKDYEFRYLLGQELKDLPEGVQGSLKGSIYAKASNMGIREAKEFILKKKEEGVIDERTAKRLIDLLYKYSVYR